MVKLIYGAVCSLDDAGRGGACVRQRSRAADGHLGGTSRTCPPRLRCTPVVEVNDAISEPALIEKFEISQLARQCGRPRVSQ